MMSPCLTRLPFLMPFPYLERWAYFRFEAAGMFNDDQIAERAVTGGASNLSIAGCANRCAARRSIVCSLVRAYRIQNRVTTVRVEVGANTKHIERAAQECLAHAFAIGVVVTDLAFFIYIANSGKRLTLIRVLRCEYVAVSDEFVVQEFLFVEDAEVIASSRVENKVDNAAEDVRHLHNRHRRNLFALARHEKAVCDRAYLEGGFELWKIYDRLNIVVIVVERK